MNTIPTWTFMNIPACDIEVNRIYQRDTHNAVINNIVRDFDYHMVNPVKVVMRDGKYYAYDGQHTALALRALFGNNFRVPCLIYDDIPTWCDEAALFEACNTKARGKKVSAAELWKSRINRCEPVATKIASICKDEGANVSVNDVGKKGIRALSALENIYTNYGEDVLRETIRILIGAWDGAKYSLDALMLNGMARFVAAYRGQYNRCRLIGKLAKTAPVNIIRAGKASVLGGVSKYAREILNVYNSGKRENRLPDLF